MSTTIRADTKGSCLPRKLVGGKEGFYRRQALNFSGDGKTMRTSVLVEEPESLFKTIEIAQPVGRMGMIRHSKTFRTDFAGF